MPRRKKQSNPIQSVPTIPIPVPNPNQNAKKWLWLLVGSFTVVILILWGWAAKIQISSVSWNKTPEKKILENSKNEWNTLFNDEATRAKNERLKLQVKNILSKIMTEINTSTTSTIPTVTSTINTTSSTLITPPTTSVSSTL
jgi:hypothetical protein